MSKKPNYSDEWPEVSFQTPIEEVQRIHKKIWQYVVDNGEKPNTPYYADCVLCEYAVKSMIEYTGDFDVITKCKYCQAKSLLARNLCQHEYEIRGEYAVWIRNCTKEDAIAVRDIPFKTMEEIENE